MEVTGIITALVIGLIIGVLGRIVAPGRQNIPIWLTLLVGVVAAIMWFTTYKPRVENAARGGSGFPPRVA